MRIYYPANTAGYIAADPTGNTIRTQSGISYEISFWAKSSQSGQALFGVSGINHLGTFSLCPNNTGGWLLASSISVGNITCTFVDQRTAKITARKFQDSNGDKRRQSTEAWLPGWTMTAYSSSGAVAATGVTGSNGQVALLRLRPGSYTICETRQSSWQHTLPATLNATFNQPCYSVTLQPNQSATVIVHHYL